MSTYQWCVAVCWSGSALLLVSGTLYMLWRLRRAGKGPYPISGPLPPVTILKPVKGTDPGLYENLASFLHLDYPDYEILICVADMADPAVPIVERLLATHPERSVRLVQGDANIGINPKVSNLHHAWAHAQHDLVLISDSNVRAPSDYLRQVVPHLAGRAGAVTAFIGCFGGDGLGGKLEESVWNTFYARWVNLAYGLGFPILIGKSLLFRQSLLRKFGGFSSFAGFVGEDYKLSRELGKLGATIELMHRPIPQYVGKKTVRAFWMRNYRWHVLQKSYEPLMFLLTPLQYPLVLGAATGSWKGLALTLGLWRLMDLLLLRSLKSESKTLHIWLLGQVLSPLIWLQALFCNTVNWRGNRLRIERVDWPLNGVAVAVRSLFVARTTPERQI